MATPPAYGHNRVSEDDHSIDGKGPFFGDVSKRLAQEITGHGVTEHRASVGGDDGEKGGCAGDKSAAIVHSRDVGLRSAHLIYELVSAQPGW